MFYRYYLEEERNELLKAELLRNELNAPLRGIQLREYVTRIRNALIEERTKEKREKIAEAVKKYVFNFAFRYRFWLNLSLSLQS
jgi:hypothetical protein